MKKKVSVLCKKKIRLRYWYRHFWLIPVTYTEFWSLTSSSQSFAYWYVYQMIRWKLKKCDMKLHLVLQKIFQLIVNCIRKKLGSKWSVNASSLFNKLTRRRYRDRLWEQNYSSKAFCTYEHSVQGCPCARHIKNNLENKGVLFHFLLHILWNIWKFLRRDVFCFVFGVFLLFYCIV